MTQAARRRKTVPSELAPSSAVEPLKSPLLLVTKKDIAKALSKRPRWVASRYSNRIFVPFERDGRTYKCLLGSVLARHAAAQQIGVLADPPSLGELGKLFSDVCGDDDGKVIEMLRSGTPVEECAHYIVDGVKSLISNKKMV
jgi:hypothetical protein